MRRVVDAPDRYQMSTITVMADVVVDSSVAGSLADSREMHDR